MEAMDVVKDGYFLEEKLSPNMGAEIRKIQIETLDKDEIERLYTSLLEHKILVFRDQKITPRALVEFSKKLGKIAKYPFARGLDEFPGVIEIRKEPEQRVNFSGKWHTDSTYLETPPDITILHAVRTPDLGGDTVFSNTKLAFDALSPGMQDLLRSSRGVNISNLHDADRSMHLKNFKTNSDNGGVFSAVHPAVRIHEDTGEEVLYVNQEHTSHFEGMTREESSTVLSYIFSHISRSEFTYRLNWSPGTIALWDNRCVQHHAVNDYHGHLRVMHRVTINRPSM